MTRSPLQRYWPLFSVTAILAILVAAGVFIVATLPPRTIVMATGPEGGTNYQLGDRYREFLAKSGIELKLMPTAGSLENLKLLRDSKSGVSVALVQGGAASGVEILGRRIPGYGRLRAAVAVPPRRCWREPARAGRPTGVDRSRGERRQSLRAGRTETNQDRGDHWRVAGIFASSRCGEIDCGRYRRRVHCDRMGLPRGPVADQRKGRGTCELPQGGRDGRALPIPDQIVGAPRNLRHFGRPPAPMSCFWPRSPSSRCARICTRRCNICCLLLPRRFIQQSGIFQKAEQFPIAESVDLPLSAEAERFHKSGRPFLQEQLPFWFAVLIGRALLVLVPVVAVAYPIIKFLPMMYNWFMSSRIQRFYGEMRSVENTMEDHAQPLDVSAMTAKIDKLEHSAIHLRLPSSYDSALYTMRIHIGLLRSHLESILENENAHFEENQSPRDLSQASPPDRKSAD